MIMEDNNIKHKDDREIIGLIPACGTASRLEPIPCSKEIYPIGFSPRCKDGNPHPKVICHYLLEKLRLAGISKAYIILRKGKWDIPAYFGDGKMLNMDIAYKVMDMSPGVPYTLDSVYPFVKDAFVAIGMPDIIFHPDDAFVRLLVRQEKTNADVVLAILPTDRAEKWDMVDLDEQGRIKRFVIKPPRTRLRYTWVVAVWTPVFTNFMHEYLIHHQDMEKQNNAERNVQNQRELYLGDIFQAAVQNGINIDTVLFREGSCLDIGTPEDMIRAVKMANEV